MSPNEQTLIYNELIKMWPQLEKEEYQFTEIYELCYKAYNALDGEPENWTLLELIDPVTFEKKWYWRKKA